MPKLAAKNLTEVGIERLPKAKPGKRYEKSDLHGPGLVLRVTDRGRKSWSCYYRRDGKHQRLTLGRWPGLGVAEARQKAHQVAEWVRAGLDPKKAARGVQEAEKAAAAAQNQAMTTFQDVALEYIKREVPRLANGGKAERMIHTWLLPAWGNMSVNSIRRRHVTELTDKLMDRNTPAMANLAYSVTRRIFTWACGRGDVELNPLSGMSPPAQKKPRDRVLKADEIAALWQAWDTEGYIFGDLQKLLLLTGQRRAEVAEMTWSEVDLENGLWTIPADRSKSNREMIVPLSDLALEVLGGVPRFAGCDYVFTTQRSKPVCNFAPGKARADAGSGVTGWRLHDLRRTCRTGLARLGVAEIVAERCLNHAPKGLSAVYNVHEYQDEKREAFQKWANEVRLITNPPDNVVALQ